MSESLQLGGNIELSGFSEVERGSMVILKKIIGNYARRFSDQCKSFEKLSLTLKSVHSAEGVKSPGKIEVRGMVLDNGKAYTSEVTDFNIFIVVDSVLKKIGNEISK